MGFRIRPGKVTCAGLVGILMVLPNSIWKGPDAKDQTVSVSAREILESGAPSSRDSSKSQPHPAPRNHNCWLLDSRGRTPR